MTGPSSGDRPAEETCPTCAGEGVLWSNTVTEPDVDCPTCATPPAVRTGDEQRPCVCGGTPWDRGPSCPRHGTWHATPQPVSGTAPWRVGSHYGIHVYEDDRPVATFHQPQDAARAVTAVNAVSGTTTRDDVARAIRDVARALPPTEDRAANRLHDLADQMELPPLLALGGSQPAQPAEEQRVWVQLPAEDVAFLRGFDPDRDRTASRADMVRVVEHLQAALDGDA